MRFVLLICVCIIGYLAYENAQVKEQAAADVKSAQEDVVAASAGTAMKAAQIGSKVVAIEQYLADTTKEKDSIAKQLADANTKIAALEKAATPVVPPAKPKPRASANPDLNAAIDRARDSGKKVVIVFRQTVCTPCDTFESRVIDSDYFKSIAQKHIEVVRVNIDKDPATDKQFGVPRTPWVVIYEPHESVERATIGGKFVPTANVDRFLDELGI